MLHKKLTVQQTHVKEKKERKKNIYIYTSYHCETLGSYLQQPHQHHVFRAHFEAKPHSQLEGNKWQIILCLMSRSKLTDSVVMDNTLLPCSSR